MRYIQADIAGKGKALLKKKDGSQSIVLLAYTPEGSSKQENERLIDKLTNVYLEYLQRIGEDRQEGKE
ncbi:hypothetical protein, partial [Eisenbergiella tayi]|uniref:hypothetical protein n=1 Tax=Eisenbergiella tayi TaxID=1432052 RepID=UPI00114D0BBD